MKPLDFLIIGAQKCATTALFEMLRAHPDVNVPLEKEVPYFTGRDCSPNTWRNYSAQIFGQEDGRLWGKASPQYLSDPGAAARIHKLMPRIKLVAILRDPIERTWSHYQMGVRREMEHRPFEDAVSDLLRAEALLRGRTLEIPTHDHGYEPESDFYVAWSEYGRMLAEFSRRFAADQLLVLYTEELESDPEATLDRLLTFIGLPAGFRPDSLGRVIHKGGGSNRVPQSVRSWLRERRLFYAAWQLVPKSRRGRLRFLYEQWNVRKVDNRPQILNGEARESLRKHFRDDLRALLSLSVAPPPWVDRYQRD